MAVVFLLVTAGAKLCLLCSHTLLNWRLRARCPCPCRPAADLTTPIFHFFSFLFRTAILRRHLPARYLFCLPPTDVEFPEPSDLPAASYSWAETRPPPCAFRPCMHSASCFFPFFLKPLTLCLSLYVCPRVPHFLCPESPLFAFFLGRLIPPLRFLWLGQ